MTYNMNLAFMGAGRIFAIQPKAKAISNAKYHAISPDFPHMPDA